MSGTDPVPPLPGHEKTRSRPVSETRLYSIAAVARLLEVRNRPSIIGRIVSTPICPVWRGPGPALPARGRGGVQGHAEGLGRGLSVDDVKAELTDRFPVTVQASRPAAKARTATPAPTTIEEAAAVFGREMARVLSGFLGMSRPGGMRPDGGAALSDEVARLQKKTRPWRPSCRPWSPNCSAAQGRPGAREIPGGEIRAALAAKS
jgi:hypothetical protein